MTDGRWDFLEDVDDEDQQFATVGIVQVRWQKNLTHGCSTLNRCGT